MSRIQESLGRVVYVHSFDVAPIALSDKVLVHRVLPRCEVVSIQLLGRESTPHLSIHYVDSSSSSSLFECELCSEATIAMSRFLVIGVGHSVAHADGLDRTTKPL